MGNWTPGPWTAEKSGYGSVISKDGKSIAAVWPEGLCGPTFPHEANARLIAAAPDLFEALVNLVACARGEGGTKPNALGLADAAIAKAITAEQAGVEK